MAQAEAKLTQLDATSRPLAAEAVRQAEVNFGNAERQLERSKELFARGFIGQAALDDAQRARDVAESQWKAAQLQFESASAGGPSAGWTRRRSRKRARTCAPRRRSSSR